MELEINDCLKKENPSKHVAIDVNANWKEHVKLLQWKQDVNKSEIHSLTVTICCKNRFDQFEIHPTYVLHLLLQDNIHQTPIIGL